MQKILNRIKENKLVKNYIWVFLGQNIGAVFSMLSLIFTLRIISTYEYGSLVIIQTYCLLISNLFSLRTFNGVIKFVTDAEQNNDKRAIKQYINTGFFLDFIAGVVSVIFGIFLLNIITNLMGWDSNTIKFVNMYLPVVFFYPLLNGTSTGIMRKMGYFMQVNLIHAIVFGLQFFLLCVTWFMHIGSFKLVVIEYVGTEILECICLLIYSIIILQKKSPYYDFWRAGLSKNIEFIKYNIYYGLISTFDQLLGNVSTLLINRFVGNFATAYIKVITRICSLFSKLTNPISQIFYPELCEWVAKKKYKKAVSVSIKYFYVVMGAGIALIGLLTITFDWWIAIFDSSMASAKIQSLLYMIYTLLSVSIICINQLTLALDLVRQNLLLTVVFDILYLILLIPSIQIWGIYGYLLLQIVQLLFVVGGKYCFIKIRVKKLNITMKGGVVDV